MSAVLLRRIFSSSVDFYDKLDQSFQQEMKNDLLKAIGDEQVQTIRKKVCDAIAELSRSLLGEFQATWWKFLSSFGSIFVSNKICCSFVETLKVLLDNFEFKLIIFYDIK